jgi:ribonuclease-3
MLQQRLGYSFRDAALLELAITHPSYLQDHEEVKESNQRLEFLGDAVLQLILTEALYGLFPADREGALSKRRSTLSKGAFLTALARELKIDESLRLSASEEQCGGRTRASTLEDAFESLVGAIYLDSDFAETRRVILGLYGPLPGRLVDTQERDNPKGQLQELVQPQFGNTALRYEVVHVSGEDHAREYEAELFLNGKPVGKGRGTSKKAAEEGAARIALDALREELTKTNAELKAGNPTGRAE